MWPVRAPFQPYEKVPDAHRYRAKRYLAEAPLDAAADCLGEFNNILSLTDAEMPSHMRVIAYCEDRRIETSHFSFLAVLERLMAITDCDGDSNA
jgi:hypothetical protein